MTRDQVIHAVLRAITWEQLQEAEEMLRQWMADHPNDWAMLDVGEVLTMSKEGLEMPDPLPVIASTAATTV